MKFSQNFKFDFPIEEFLSRSEARDLVKLITFYQAIT